VVDAPHELKEENELRDALNNNGLSLIKLAAPTTDEKRLEDIVKISSGFIYQVNVSGVTGVNLQTKLMLQILSKKSKA
jgi:tryptophan synthase alpha chain